MARSSFLKSLAALAIVAAITYFVILPMLNQGQGGVIVTTKKKGNSSNGQASSQDSSSDGSGGESTPTKGGYIYRGPDGPVSNYLRNLPAAPIKGTSGPLVKAITLRIPQKVFYWKKAVITDKNGNVVKRVNYIPPGYYFIESKICWEHCGCSDKHIYNLVDLTKTPIPKNKTQSIFMPPQSGFGDVVIFAVPLNPLESVWYFYIPKAEVDKVLPECEGRAYDYLIVDSRVLYAGSSKDPSKATPISDWMRQLYMRFGMAGPSTPEEFKRYSEGVEFVEVNGYVHMLLPQQSVFGAPIVVNATALVLLIISLMVVAVVWWRWKR